MRFRRQQDEARAATLRLLLLFALLLLAVVVAVNLALAGLYSLLSLGSWGYPPLFFETNTAVVLLFVLGGSAVEAGRLRDAGGARVALAVGGREIVEARDLAERRLLNVLDEMALASGLPRPVPYVLEREPGINAFVAGWGHGDDGQERRGPVVLGVTRGALDCLTRDELQGLVAHEFGHIKAGDLRLQMWLLALVWGLSLVHGYGRKLGEPDDQGRPNLPGLLFGAVFVVLGWLGWLAGRVLQAAVSRQREYGADASAVQFTRSRDGLAGTLRKIRFQSEIEHTRLQHPQAQLLAAMLLHAPARTRWLATHPPLAERIKRICGRELPPLPARPVDLEAEAEQQLENTQAGGQSTMDSLIARGEDAPDHPWAESPAAHPASPLLQAAAMTLDVSSQPPDSQPDADRPAAAADAFTPLALRRHAADQDELDAIGRLNFLHGAGERRTALLALILTPGSAREKQAWREETATVASAGRVRADVARLSVASRLPVFELLLQRTRNAPVAERQALVEAARRVMGADGQVRPIDRLHWLAMRRVLGEASASPAAASGGDNDPASLSLSSVEQIAVLTAWFARLVPAPISASADGTVSSAGNAWYEAVMSHWAQRYRAEGRRVPVCHPPDADGMAHALWSVQALSWMLKPVLLRAWVDAAVGMSAKATLLPEAADALRLLALLLDTPMPPALAEHFLEVKLA